MVSRPRRDVLRASCALAGVGLAGCLSDVDAAMDELSDESTTMNDETQPDEVENEPDSESIDGRLRNEDDVERVFEVTITDESGTSRDGTFEVGPGETTRIPAVGSPGDVLTVEASVDGTDETATVELGGEAKPGELAGFLDVIYRADGRIDIIFEPTD